eukprot:CAMPEP_0177430334 /NCGR_PEP_ID=MMETSP0368-20130122/75610_1 /TAXON_ID=447022 ORGANISM="Scrippsiella hangoei-like, Strain SHHI-4" /NCGR_SAMPLE_ID=MMETSP0368 /ASSEMBLY_ACC=CAM_ASM_000363 /LENGTH=217 /DNA_ID=CAMNT_0018900939 /DNA_START=413 /DNA_END=1063 /DNA_ORIENTATION=+
MWNLTEHCDGFRLMRGLSRKPTDCTEDAVAFLLLVRNNVGLPISEAVSRAFGLAHLVVGLPPFSKAASLPSCRPADCFGEAVAFLLLDRAAATGLPSSEADVRERRDETDGLRTTWKTSPSGQQVRNRVLVNCQDDGSVRRPLWQALRLLAGPVRGVHPDQALQGLGFDTHRAVADATASAIGEHRAVALERQHVAVEVAEREQPQGVARQEERDND